MWWARAPRWWGGGARRDRWLGGTILEAGCGVRWGPPWGLVVVPGAERDGFGALGWGWRHVSSEGGKNKLLMLVWALCGPIGGPRFPLKSDQWVLLVGPCCSGCVTTFFFLGKKKKKGSSDGERNG